MRLKRLREGDSNLPGKWPITEDPETGGAKSGALEAPDSPKPGTHPGQDNPTDPLVNIAKAIGQLSQADRQRLIDLLAGVGRTAQDAR